MSVTPFIAAQIPANTSSMAARVRKYWPLTQTAIPTIKVALMRRQFVVAGCEPDEIGIGPVLAVPRLLERAGLDVDDIGPWEFKGAFASQAMYCVETLGQPEERLNVDRGAISVGHPYGMSGTRLVGHALLEGPAPRRALGCRHDVRRCGHGSSRAIRRGMSPSRLSSCRDLSVRSAGSARRGCACGQTRRPTLFVRRRCLRRPLICAAS